MVFLWLLPLRLLLVHVKLKEVVFPSEVPLEYLGLSLSHTCDAS